MASSHALVVRPQARPHFALVLGLPHYSRGRRAASNTRPPSAAASAAASLADTAAAQLSLGWQALSALKVSACAAAAALTAGAAAAGPCDGGSAGALPESEELWWPLLLSTLAGLATSIGGVLAVALPQSERMLAFLLGLAIGVMVTVSSAGLWWHTAAELGDLPGVSLAVAAGAGAFALLDPLLPKVPDGEELELAVGASKQEQQPQQQQQQHAALDNASRQTHRAASSSARAAGSRVQPVPQAAAAGSDSAAAAAAGGAPEAARADLTQAPKAPIRHRGSLLRLSLLMGVTMTLHNLPEGSAVAFSASTDLAPVVVLAIGLHNLPEGIVCAAPLYAATGSKAQAVALATASGLSEPLGALGALLLIKPYLHTLEALDYALAATGGVMLAVCALELWPEARKCGCDDWLAAGVALGACVMLWTLWVGV